MLLALLTVLLTGCLVGAVAAEPAAPPGARGRLMHVVSLKFKPEATPAQIQEVEKAFRALKTQIPRIVSLEWGTNVSPEGLNKGFTHAFVLRFRNDKDRDAYLVDPAHKAFGQLLHPVLADVLVIDFWIKH